MKRLFVFLIIALILGIAAIGFSRRGQDPENGRWSNRDKDEEQRWGEANITDPDYTYDNISRYGEDSDGPLSSTSNSGAHRDVIGASARIKAEGSDAHDVWEWSGSATLSHDWITTTPGPNPDQDSGGTRGDFEENFSINLDGFDRDPEDTISGCSAWGWVATDYGLGSSDEDHDIYSYTNSSPVVVYSNGSQVQ